MNPILGVLFHAVGGLAAGSFYAPCKKVKGWAWETYWLVLGIFAWIIAPFVMASIFTPGFVGILKAVPLRVVFWSYSFGVLWGIGGLTFGLTMRYLGISLGVSVALGFCAVFGTLVPPLFAGEFVGLVTSGSGLITLAGVALCLLGIAICGKAGMMKEKDLSTEEKAEGIAEFDFKKGIWVAIVPGFSVPAWPMRFKPVTPYRNWRWRKVYRPYDPIFPCWSLFSWAGSPQIASGASGSVVRTGRFQTMARPKQADRLG